VSRLIPLIIDTDVALGAWHEGRPRDIDDGFAIIEAMNAEAIDLLGVTTVYGNAPHGDVYRIAKELIELKQSKTAVAAGATSNAPSASPPTHSALPAVEFIAQELRKQPLTIAAIGPLTNIAALVRKYPELIPNIEMLVVVAGRTPGNRFYISGTGPVADFNFDNDVIAMQTLLDAKLPMVLAGFELTSQVVITEQDLESIRARQTPLANYFYENSIDWVRHWTKTFAADDGFHPWDSAAINYLLHPEHFVAEQRIARIGRLDGAPTLDCHPAEEVIDPTAGALPVTYLTGFTPGGKARFVADVVTNLY